MKIRAALAAAFLLAAPALAQEPPRRIVTSIMHEPGDAADALSGLRDGEIVYLDILFLDPGDTCVGDWGSLSPAPGARLGLPQDGDNHLLVQVAPGAPEAFPFNAVTCEYAPTLEGMTALRLRGFYTGLTTGIPTARLLLLNPVRLDPMVESAVARAGPPEQ